MDIAPSSHLFLGLFAVGIQHWMLMRLRPPNSG